MKVYIIEDLIDDTTYADFMIHIPEFDIWIQDAGWIGRDEFELCCWDPLKDRDALVTYLGEL